MTKAELAEVLDYLLAAFPGASIRGRTPDVWMDALGMFDGDLVMEAAKRYIQRGERYFPQPGEIGAIVCDILEHRAAQEREAQERRNREAMREAADALFIKPHPQGSIAKQCTDLIRHHRPGDRAGYIRRMMELHKNFPKAGFDECAMRLASEWGVENRV